MLKLSHLAMVLACAATLAETADFAKAASGSDKAYAAAMDQMMHAIMKPATGKPDLDFVTGMIPHHEGAVAMAKVEKKFGNDPKMLQLADAVIAAQTSEVTVMKGWLANKKLSTAAADPASKTASSTAMDTMMKNMKASATGNADIDFAKGMIPHHQGAVDMAQAELKYGADTDVKKLAQGVVDSQTREIAQMNAWLIAHGG